jgi:hypothetical protein
MRPYSRGVGDLIPPYDECFRRFFFFAGAGGFVEAPSSIPMDW